jgi:UDP-MurNAc hydroxylase
VAPRSRHTIEVTTEDQSIQYLGEMAAPLITWVNHASYVLETSDAVLLTDPWFEGTAFDDGWALYSQTRADEDLLRRVTHIWLSHEHPDHFSPSSLRSIPQEARHQITVLYQTSRDRKVVDCCRDLEFGDVQELRSNIWVQLSDELRIMCNPWRLGDSYLAVETPAGLVLNLNDCVITTAREAEAILDDLGRRSPRIVLMQYGYANRVGNPEQVGLRQAAARSELESVATAISVLQPKYIVPFASFIWFCHRENTYMNDSQNTASDAIRFVRECTTSSPVVLYPGECWSLHDEPPPADRSAGRYDADLSRRVQGPPLIASDPVPLATLLDDGRAFAADLRSANGNFSLAILERLGKLGPLNVWVSDLGRALLLGRHGLEPAVVPANGCDIALTSGALAFLLRHRYGGATLFMNGRFSAPPEGRLERILPLVNLRDANNRGVGVGGWLFARLLHRVERSRPAGSRLARWLRRHQ